MTILNKKSFFRKLIIVFGIAAIIIVVLININFNSEDKPFKYGSSSYYLSVNKVVQKFPLIGAERRKTVYEIFGGDGPSAPTISLIYTSNSDINEVNAFYRKVCNKQGYRFKPDESSSQTLNFTAKKPFSELSIELYPTKQGSKVRLIFFYEL